MHIKPDVTNKLEKPQKGQLARKGIWVTCKFHGRLLVLGIKILLLFIKEM